MLKLNGGGLQPHVWDFYRGFAFVISVQLVVMTIVAWQLSVLGKSNPRAALPAAVICSTGAVARLSSDIRGRETQPARGFNGLAAPSR